jgi:carbon-monoxide dehydrogenase medium subunit
LTPFELAEPGSLAEALELLQGGEDVRPVAGGTATMLMMKTGIFRPAKLVSLRRIEPKFHAVETMADGSLLIGALATLSGIERSSHIAKAAPVVTKTLRTLSNVRVRNVATLGGHLAHADPHMDLPPVLTVLGATLEIVGPSGNRTLETPNLFEGYLQNTLETGELIVAAKIPAQGARRAAYVKVTTRSADDWPALGLAVSLELNGDVIIDARLALGAATETPCRLTAAEKELKGSKADAASLRRAGDAAAEETPISADAQGSASYKRELLRVYLGRAVQQALAGGAA